MCLCVSHAFGVGTSQYSTLLSTNQHTQYYSSKGTPCSHDDAHIHMRCESEALSPTRTSKFLSARFVSLGFACKSNSGTSSECPAPFSRPRQPGSCQSRLAHAMVAHEHLGRASVLAHTSSLGVELCWVPARLVSRRFVSRRFAFTRSFRFACEFWFARDLVIARGRTNRNSCRAPVARTRI